MTTIFTTKKYPFPIDLVYGLLKSQLVDIFID